MLESTAEGNASAWRRLAPKVVDNYYIRSLLGPSVFHLPVGSLHKGHTHAAQRLLLEEFDVLLILADRSANGVMLRSALGWSNGTLPHANANRLRPNKYHLFTGHTKKLLETAVLDLERANQLDKQVYNYARLLQQLDLLIFSVAARLTQRTCA